MSEEENKKEEEEEEEEEMLEVGGVIIDVKLGRNRIWTPGRWGGRGFSGARGVMM